MPSILYPWKSTSIIKDAASVIQPPKKGGKGQGSGGGSVGKGGQGNGLGKGRGGGAGGGSTPPSSGGGSIVTTGLWDHIDVSDYTKVFSDIHISTPITETDGTLVRSTVNLDDIDTSTRPGGALNYWYTYSTTQEGVYKLGVVNGLNAWQISDIGSKLGTPNNWDTTYSSTSQTIIFCISHLPTTWTNAWGAVFGNSTAAFDLGVQYGTSNNFQFTNNGTNLVSTQAVSSATDAYVVRLKVSTIDNCQFAVNGETPQTGGTVGTLTDYRFNHSGGLGSLYKVSPFYVCEVLMYDGYLSDTNCEVAEAYLASKWGVTLV